MIDARDPRDRRDVARFVEAQFDEQSSSRVSGTGVPGFDAKGAHHYGRCEVRQLLDFVYGGPPMSAEEEIRTATTPDRTGRPGAAPSAHAPNCPCVRCAPWPTRPDACNAIHPGGVFRCGEAPGHIDAHMAYLDRGMPYARWSA
jgi:hypothetical protein